MNTPASLFICRMGIVCLLLAAAEAGKGKGIILQGLEDKLLLPPELPANKETPEVICSPVKPPGKGGFLGFIGQKLAGKGKGFKLPYESDGCSPPQPVPPQQPPPSLPPTAPPPSTSSPAPAPHSPSPSPGLPEYYPSPSPAVPPSYSPPASPGVPPSNPPPGQPPSGPTPPPPASPTVPPGYPPPSNPPPASPSVPPKYPPSELPSASPTPLPSASPVVPPSNPPPSYSPPASPRLPHPAPYTPQPAPNGTRNSPTPDDADTGARCSAARCGKPLACELPPTCVAGRRPRCPAAARCQSLTGRQTCVYKYKPRMSLCYRSTRSCDLNVTCTGSSGECPTGQFGEHKFKPFGTECRAATGTCGSTATCSGMSAECPVPHDHGKTGYTYRCNRKIYCHKAKPYAFRRHYKGKGWDIGGCQVGDGTETFAELDDIAATSAKEVTWNGGRAQCTPSACPGGAKPCDAVFLVCKCNPLDLNAPCNWVYYDNIAWPVQQGSGMCPRKPSYAVLA